MPSEVTGRPQQKAHNDSMLGAFAPALLIARCFGILPVPNLNGESRDFQWRSLRSVYALLILLFILFEAVLSIARLAVIGVTFQSSGKCYKNYRFQIV